MLFDSTGSVPQIIQIAYFGVKNEMCIDSDFFIVNPSRLLISIYKAE